MKLAPSDIAVCREHVERVLQVISAQLRETDPSDVAGPLARCANRLNDEPAPPAEEVTLLLRTTLAAGMLRVARGQLQWQHLAALAPAFDATLRRPADENPLLGFTPGPDDRGPRRAFWAPPAKVWLWEARIAMPEPLKQGLAEEVVAAREEYQQDLAGEEPLPADDAVLAEAADAAGEAPAAESSPPEPPAQIYDPEQKPPPPVRFLPEHAPVVPLFRHYALVVEQALDTIALLNAHRLERTLSEAPDEELRIWELLDAAITTGPDLVENAEHWWAENLDSPDEWKIWAPCYVLGSLEDARAPLALDRILNDLDPEMTEQVVAAAQGLHLARGSSVGLLVRELRRSPNPLKRAVGVSAASYRKELSPEDIATHLADPSAAVVEAALTAAGRSTQLTLEAQDRLVPFLFSGVPGFVRAAAKALLLHGRPEPYRELEHGTLERELGGHLLEFLVWTGSERDVPRIERFVQGRELSGEQLQQIALFGHPAMWAFLAHFLSDEDLQDDAVAALTLLLGVGVSDEQRFQPGAWEAQLGRVAPALHTRYRLGRPFHTGSVQEEHQLRRVSYRALESRLDEMAIRTGTRVDTPLHGWTGDSEGRLQVELMKLHQTASALRVGSWDVRGRG